MTEPGPATSAVNVADIVREAAEDHPSKPALWFQGRTFTYEELDDIIDTIGAALAGIGVRPGDRVALIAGNVPEFITSFYGTLRVGAVISPVNVMLTPTELSAVLADSGAKVAITELAWLPNLPRGDGPTPCAARAAGEKMKAAKSRFVAV